MHINHSILKNQRLPSFLYFSPFQSVIGFTADVQLGFFVCAPILLKIIRTIETMKTVVRKSKKIGQKFYQYMYFCNTFI